MAKNRLKPLHKFRKEKNLTQQEIASILGVSLSMYEKVERGYIKASRNFIETFKRKYPQIDIDYIFFS